MNRENKRKQFQKDIIKHTAAAIFYLQGVRKAGCTGRRRQQPPQPLSELPEQPPCGHRTRGPGIGLRGDYGAGKRLGEKNGEWAIIHRCRSCGSLSSNRVAADDNPMKLMSIALKPLTLPPFPLERIEELTALMGGEGSLEK